MKFKILPMLLALSVLPASTVWADDEIETGQVVISASRIEQQLDDVSSNIGVITAEDIEKMGVTNLANLLNMQSNITTSNTTALPSIRGMGGDYTLFLIDGRKMMKPERHGTDHMFESINVNNIERIEIIKGAAATMYGSDAMGGVINIITKKGVEPSGSISVSASNEVGTTSYYYDFGRVGNWTGKIDANISETWGISYTNYDFDSTTGELTENGYEDNEQDGIQTKKSIGGSIGYYFSDNLDILGSYNYQETRHITRDFYEDGTYTDSLVDKRYNFVFHNASVDLQGSLGGHYFSLTPWISTVEQVRTSPQYSTNTSYFYGDTGVDLMDTFTINDWNMLSAGASYTMSMLDDPESSNFYSMHKVGAFLQDEMLLLDEKLILFPSVRFDYSNYSTPQFTAKLGTTYEFMPNHRIKFNVDNAFRTPTLKELQAFVGNGSSITVLADNTTYSSSGSKNDADLGFVAIDGVIYGPETQEYKDVVAGFGTFIISEVTNSNSSASSSTPETELVTAAGVTATTKDNGDGTYTHTYTSTSNGYNTTYNVDGNGGGVLGMDDLEPETSVTVDLRYEGNIAGVKLGVGGYYIMKFNEISSDVDRGLILKSGTYGTADAVYSPSTYYFNHEHTTHYRGLEAEAEYPFADYFTASLNYAFMNNAAENGGRLSGYATHAFNASLNFSYPDWATFANIWGNYNIDFNSSAQYSNDTYMNDQEAYDGLAYNYWTINASVGKTFKEKYVVVASAENLIQRSRAYERGNGSWTTLGWNDPEYKLTFTAKF